MNNRAVCDLINMTDSEFVKAIEACVGARGNIDKKEAGEAAVDICCCKCCDCSIGVGRHFKLLGLIEKFNDRIGCLLERFGEDFADTKFASEDCRKLRAIAFDEKNDSYEGFVRSSLELYQLVLVEAINLLLPNLNRQKARKKTAVPELRLDVMKDSQEDITVKRLRLSASEEQSKTEVKAESKTEVKTEPKTESKAGSKIGTKNLQECDTAQTTSVGVSDPTIAGLATGQPATSSATATHPSQSAADTSPVRDLAAGSVAAFTIGLAINVTKILVKEAEKEVVVTPKKILIRRILKQYLGKNAKPIIQRNVCCMKSKCKPFCNFILCCDCFFKSCCCEQGECKYSNPCSFDAKKYARRFRRSALEFAEWRSSFDISLYEPPKKSENKTPMIRVFDNTNLAGLFSRSGWSTILEKLRDDELSPQKLSELTRMKAINQEIDWISQNPQESNKKADAGLQNPNSDIKDAGKPQEDIKHKDFYKRNVELLCELKNSVGGDDEFLNNVIKTMHEWCNTGKITHEVRKNLIELYVRDCAGKIRNDDKARILLNIWNEWAAKWQNKSNMKTPTIVKIFEKRSRVYGSAVCCFPFLIGLITLASIIYAIVRATE